MRLFAKVKRGGEASRGGLQANDIVVSVNGIAVGGPEEFKSQVAKSLAFETIDLVVLRKGRKIAVKVPPSTGGAAVPKRPRRGAPDPRESDLSATVESATR